MVVEDIDGAEGREARWIEPTLVFADGSTRRLTERPWDRADALWDSVSTDPAPGGRAMMHGGRAIVFGIGTLTPSQIEYVLPPGVVRFKATGAIDDNETPRPGAVRFIVNIAIPATERLPAVLPVHIARADLGFAGPVRVRDLWSHTDLGEISGEFIPEIPYHGAGLYRISPVAP